jgi:hypothetical protein
MHACYIVQQADDEHQLHPVARCSAFLAAAHLAAVVCRRGEGMPVSRQPGQRGNLLIKFDVTFPRQLNSSQKEQIRSLLPSGL